jgi:hypothetical protein
MSDRFKGRKKPELPGQEPEWSKTLKEWVRWALVSEFVDDEAREQAKAVNNLYSLLGMKDKRLEEALEVIRFCANEDAYFNALDGGPHHVKDIFKRAREFLAKVEGG